MAFLKVVNDKKPEEIKFRCKVGRMGSKGYIIWIPKRFLGEFEHSQYVEVNIRKLA